MDFRINAWAGSKHPTVPYGAHVLSTWHKSEASAAIEIAVLQERMRSGDISHAQLIDCRPGGMLTEERVNDYTIVPWSWRR